MPATLFTKRRLFVALLILTAAGALTAFPFWLDPPSRTNPFDPKTPQNRTRKPVRIIFEDFEAGALLKPGTWGDSGSSVSQGVTGAFFKSSSQSDGLLVTSTGYGAGANFQSNYFNASGYIDATGAVFLDYSIRADQPFSYTVRWKEGSENGGDKENWKSAVQNYTAVNSWQDLKLMLADFTEDPNGDSACTPNCLASGNAHQDLKSVKQFEIQVLAPVTGIHIYLDDIYFEIPVVIPPTYTPTLTPTITPIPTPCGVCVSPSITFGNTTQGLYANSTAGTIEATTFALGGSGGEIESISVYVGAVTGDMQLSLYLDAGGKTPTTRLAYTAVFTPTPNGWNTQPVTAQICLAPGNYFLAFTRQSNGTQVYFDADPSEPSAGAADTEYPGTPPNPYPGLWGHDVQSWSLHANLCP